MQDMPMDAREQPLWDGDLIHPGALCAHVREARGVSPSDMAAWCNVNTSRIATFEHRGVLGEARFERYLELLQAERLSEAISADDARLLRTHYHLSHTRKARERLEQELLHVNFQHIVSSKVPAMSRLVAELKELDWPAYVMDAAGCVHCVNGAILGLFGMAPDDPYLWRWEAWNFVATKFHPDSSMRKAHTNPNEYFPLIMRTIFRDDQTCRYLFTWQQRMLLYKVHQLSTASGLLFSQWWRRAIRLQLHYYDLAPTRTLAVGDQHIPAQADPGKVVPVEIAKGCVVRYIVGTWRPIRNEASEKVFAGLMAATNSRTLYFAAEYDEQRSFHVNTWPEVTRVIGA